MKKILILLLTASLLTMTACAGKKETVAPAYEPPAATAAATPAPSPTPTATPVPTPEPPDESLLPGERRINTYTNEYFGVACHLDGPWTFYTGAQIEELAQMSAAALEGDEASVLFTQPGGDRLYCMAAASGTRNVNMVVQDLAEDVSASDAAAAAASDMVDVLLAAGLNDLSVVNDEGVFAGKKVPRVTVSGTIGEQPFFARVAVFRAWDHLAAVTASAGTLEDAQALLDLWYAVG